MRIRNLSLIFVVVVALALVIAQSIVAQAPQGGGPPGGPGGGAPGAGGSLGFADPTVVVGYGYVTSQMGTHITGDPRDIALRDALYTAIQRS